MHKSMALATGRQECIFVAQVLSPLSHVVNVCSIAAADRAVWV